MAIRGTSLDSGFEGTSVSPFTLGKNEAITESRKGWLDGVQRGLKRAYVGNRVAHNARLVTSLLAQGEVRDAEYVLAGGAVLTIRDISLRGERIYEANFDPRSSNGRKFAAFFDMTDVSFGASPDCRANIGDFGAEGSRSFDASSAEFLEQSFGAIRRDLSGIQVVLDEAVAGRT